MLQRAIAPQIGSSASGSGICDARQKASESKKAMSDDERLQACAVLSTVSHRFPCKQTCDDLCEVLCNQQSLRSPSRYDLVKRAIARRSISYDPIPKTLDTVYTAKAFSQEKCAACPASRYRS